MSLLPIWGATDSLKKKKKNTIWDLLAQGFRLLQLEKKNMPSKSSVNMSVNLLMHASAVMTH